MSTVNTPQVNPKPGFGEPVESPGALLRIAREQAQLSQGEVAEKLRLLRRQVAALEEDRFDYFNAEIFCKGYLRSYGKFIGVDQRRLIDAYTKQRPASLVEIEPAVSKKVSPIQSPIRGSSFQYWCIGLVALLVIVLWGMSVDEHNVAPSPSLLEDEHLLTVDKSDRSLFESLNSKAAAVALAGEQTIAGEQLVVGNKTAVIESVRQPSTGSGLVSPSLAISDSAAISNTAVAGVVTVSDATSETLEQTGQDVLSFRFSGDCWIQVTDSNNEVLVSDLKRAEDVLNLRGRAPFKVIMGYAPAVTLHYNGENITIRSNRRDNTARIVVGQS